MQFLHFDFHRFCKGGNFQALRVLINELNDSMESYGAFSVDLDTGDVLTQQVGVYRVNCLDSIDRTNVAMSQIGLTVF